MSERGGATFIVVSTLLALTGPLVADDRVGDSGDPAAVAVRRRLGELLAKQPKGVDVGLLVVDATDDSVWFSHQPRLPLKPASVMKLFISAAALERFGPNFVYETRLYVSNDELLVLGGGDPGLGDERIAGRHGWPLHSEFDDWARRLKERGIATLKTIVLDDSVFDRQHRHPDWPPEQAQAWYQAPVGGLNFNDNCLDADFSVGGGRVDLSLRPDLPASFVRNALVASSKHKPVVKRTPGQDVFEFRGPVARNDRFGPVSAARPSVLFGHALRRALETRGISASGPVVRREIDLAALSDAAVLDVRTTTLRDALWRCNTFSQNLFAECLLKSLVAYERDGSRSDEAGSWAGGVRVLEATLRELGLAIDGAVFRDGSGLSHENRVTAEQIARLLVTMRRHPHSAVFVESFAQPRQQGSLRRRYRDPALLDRLRAKTGTIRGVRALAGYVSRPDGTTLAFALLANGGVPQSLPVKVAEALVEAGVSARP